MNASDENRDRVYGNRVGAWMQRAVVNERHELTRTYPHPLMPLHRVRVHDFTITLNNELTGKPESAARSRRFFEELTDLIENAVIGFNAGIESNQNGSHNSSPVRSGPGTGNTGVPAEIVQESADIPSPGAGGAGGCPCGTPASSSEDAS